MLICSILPFGWYGFWSFASYRSRKSLGGLQIP